MNKKITSFFISRICISQKQILLILVSFVCFGFFYGPNIIAYDGLPYKTNGILIKYNAETEIKKVNVDKNDINSLLRFYNSLDEVEYAEPNYIYKSSIIPSDIYYNNQWYLNKIKAPQAWGIVRESPEITIAIIDSGVQIIHPDLKDNIWVNSKEIANNEIDDDKNGFIDDINGWDFVNKVADPSPKFDAGFTQDGIIHGTVVAGVAAAFGNNGIGISGVNWQAKIMALKVLDDKGEGDTDMVVRAIDYAVKNGADIINFSFVGYGFSQTLENAIRRAYEAGLILVAAAGNDLGEGDGINIDDTPIYPACHDGKSGENMVIGVSATDTLDQKASFAAFGKKCVDLVAPGVSIFSTSVYAPGREVNGTLFNKYYEGYWSGTSMAVPMVSAAVSLIESVNPSLSQDDIIQILKQNTDNINRLNPSYLGLLGSGRLNIAKSVISAKEALNNTQVSIILTPFSEDSSQIKIVDRKGNINSKFFAYNKNFRGGVHVASGDVDGDGIDEIITGAGNGGGPHVRVFDLQGNTKGQFFAYNKNFRGGVHVSAGDVDGDGIDEIITGAGNGGGPQVRLFKLSGKVLGQFFAYDKNFRGGVRIAAASFHQGARGSKLDIITAPGTGGGPHIKIFDSRAKIIGQFFAYSKKFRGGVIISAADIDNDGYDEIITGAGPGGTPHIRVFKSNGTLINSFFGLDENFDGGVSVAAVKIFK